MQDRQTRDELEGLHSLGDLADEVVVTLGRVVRHEPLSHEDRKTLGGARALFDLMTSHDVVHVGTTARRMLGDESSFLNALRAVERQANGDTIEEYATTYVRLLDRVLTSTDPLPVELDLPVGRLRDFFSFLSETTLSREDELGHSGQESPWRAMPKLASNF